MMFTLGDTETNVGFARKSKQVLAINFTDALLGGRHNNRSVKAYADFRV